MIVIYRMMHTQRELAEELGVHETQVSRDERNEYHGITVQRAATILDALGARLDLDVGFDRAGRLKAVHQQSSERGLRCMSTSMSCRLRDSQKSNMPAF